MSEKQTSSERFEEQDKLINKLCIDLQSRDQSIKQLQSLLAQRDAEIQKLQDENRRIRGELANIRRIQEAKFSGEMQGDWMKELSEETQGWIMTFWEGSAEWEDRCKQREKELDSLRKQNEEMRTQINELKSILKPMREQIIHGNSKTIAKWDEALKDL